MNSVKRLVAIAACGCTLGWAASPAAAQDPKPVTDNSVSAVDVAATPIDSLNLRKKKVPAVLSDASANPYDLRGLSRCPAIAAEVRDLDAALGDDFDVAQASGRSMNAGYLAKSVVGSFIPFNGLIKEISGANAQERKMQAMIYAGVARRSFLKGVGQARGCGYPARTATARDIAALRTQAPVPAKKKK